MIFTEKFVRRQLERAKPLLSSQSLEAARKGQDRIGVILTKQRRHDVDIEDIDHKTLTLSLVTPHDERKDGIVLYLHGGGYTCGGIEYARGFASVLANECGVRVLCCAYSLAPERPFPAAVSDALEAYRYILTCGYHADQIVLAGESAGGGLCYSLCIRLKQLNIAMPAGIIAMSPWTDLTQSGESIVSNATVDPSLSKSTLDFYADCYTADKLDPLASPIFGDLSCMPPSLIFVGGDEILLDDAVRLHKELIAHGCESELNIAEHMWHAYVLYCLKEHMSDYKKIDDFLLKRAAKKRKLRWMKLDNAAKIYPAARRRNWNNFFRLSATLTEDVDRAVLQSAVDVTIRRFPSIAVRLCSGMFWYYLEELPKAPEISDEKSWPLDHTPFESINKCALRIICHGRRIAVEFYHALTDGTGGMIFLKSLLAEYIEQKHGISIPCECGILDRLQEPREEELEDSFSKNAGSISAKRNASTVYRIRYTPERGGRRHLTSFIINSDDILSKAHEHGISVTVFLTAAMLLALQTLQDEQVPNKNKQRPIRVVIPVNLRKFFPSDTLRNFVHVVMPEIDPRMGDYTFDEIATSVKHQLGMLVTKKNMQAGITPNVNAERSTVLRIMPLFIKNIAMKLVYDTVGERTNCLNLSNLGAVELPEIMKPYIDRFDFILGVQATKPNNCGVLSYNGKLIINFIRNTVEPSLEMHFFNVLKQFGVPVKVESNLGSMPNNSSDVSHDKKPQTKGAD